MNHYLVVLIALAMLALSRMAYPDLIKFKLKSFLRFASIMLFLFFLKLSIMATTKGGYSVPAFFDTTNIFRLLTVFWEDVFFVLPSLILFKEGMKGFAIFLHIFLVSVIFASLHMYQGVAWALITLFYVPVNYYLAKRVGLLTTAACHVLYDVSTYLTILLWVYLK